MSDPLLQVKKVTVQMHMSRHKGIMRASVLIKITITNDVVYFGDD